jgi:Flp pilus assembly protein TadD
MISKGKNSIVLILTICCVILLAGCSSDPCSNVKCPDICHGNELWSQLCENGKCIDYKRVDSCSEYCNCTKESVDAEPEPQVEQTSPPTTIDVEEYYNDGLSLYDQKKYDEAIENFEKVLELDPDHKKAKEYLIYALQDKGAELSDQGRHSVAITYFDRAIAIDPNDGTSWSIKGFVLNKQGKYSDAITCFDKAIELDPKVQLNWANKGRSLFNLGRYSESIICFDEAISLNSKDAYTWHYKGLALEKLERYTEAQQCFDKAKELGYLG